MAEKILNTKFRLRYDTLANWNTSDPVLLKGEIAVVAVPSDATGDNTFGQDTKPSILFKVGDGTSKFKALPFASARAADVYSWAKASTKPSYTATEISFANGGNSDLESTTVSGALNELRNKDADLNTSITNLSSNVYTKSQTYTKEEINQAIEDMAGEIQGSLEADTNTRYQLVFDSSTGYIKLQSKDIGETSWKDISGQSFDLSSLTVAKAEGVSTKVVAGDANMNDVFKLPFINEKGEFVEGVSAYSDLGKGITATRSAQGPILTTNITGNASSAESATKDKNGNVIDTHYATKTELSTGLSGKADSSSLSQQVSRLEGLIDEAVTDVKDIANGKTNTFVTSKVNKDESFNNSVFNTQNADVTVTNSSKILLIDGTNYLSVVDLKLGDVILVKETDVPDRWVSAVSESNGLTTVTLSKMETAKVDLTPYVLASTVINGKTLEDDIVLTGGDIKVSTATSSPTIATALSTLSGDLDAVVEAFTGGEYIAAKATQDGDGNVIKDTYATKTEVTTVDNKIEADGGLRDRLVAVEDAIADDIPGSFEEVTGRLDDLEGLFTDDGKANDAAKLGGQAASYYAKASTVTALSNNIVPEGIVFNLEGKPNINPVISILNITNDSNVKSILTLMVNAYVAGAIDTRFAQRVKFFLKQGDARFEGVINSITPGGDIVIKFSVNIGVSTYTYEDYDYFVTIVPSSLTITNVDIERRFNYNDVFVFNGGNAAGAYN